MEIRIMASDPAYEEINYIARMIAVYKNPWMWFDVLDDEEMQDPLSVKRFDAIKKLEAMMNELAIDM
jgi:hypothetical protein